MPVPPLNPTALLQSHDPNAPIHMLNLFKHRPQAVFPADVHPSINTTPCTGHESLARYIEGIRPLMPPNSAPIFQSSVKGIVAGLSKEEGGVEWDTVVLVKYESLQGFVDMVNTKVYKESVEAYRVAGLEEYRLIAVQEEALP